MISSPALGQIITFYSYKGGTGRTMALANIACLLAQQSNRKDAKPVLAVDWDLEAPGLHLFLKDLPTRGDEGPGKNWVSSDCEGWSD